MLSRRSVVAWGIAAIGGLILLIGWLADEAPDRSAPGARSHPANPEATTESALDRRIRATATAGRSELRATTTRNGGTEADVFGLVVGEEGAPVAGATITAIEFPDRDRSLPVSEIQSRCAILGATRSALDGTFLLPLAPGRSVDLEVEAASYASSRFTFVHAGETVTIVLRRGCRLRVHVLDEAGSPLAGARVHVERSLWLGSRVFEVEGQADDEGHCGFDSLPGPCVAFVWVTHADVARSGDHPISLPASGTEEFEMTVKRGRPLSGRVLDGGSHMPIPDARIGVGWTFHAAVSSDANGRFRLGGWVGDSRLTPVYATAPGYGVESMWPPESGETDILLWPELCVTGLAVDQAGRAISDALVCAMGKLGDGSPGTTLSAGYARTDAAGRFRVRGLNPRCAHTLVIRAAGFGRHVQEIGAPAAGETGIDLGMLHLDGGATVRGCVVDDSGAPVPRMEVYLRFTGGEESDPTSAPSQWRAIGHQEFTFTDNLGRFRFQDLAPGSYWVLAMPEGERPVRDTLAVERGGEVHVRVRLPGLRTLRVRVVSWRGEPVENARLLVVAGTETSTEFTDGSGIARVRVRGVPQQLAVPFSGRPDCLPARLSPVDPLAREVEVVLAAGEQARGVVERPTGPLPYAQLELSAVDWRAPCVADGDGRFLAVVPAGVALSIRYLGVVGGKRDGPEWVGEIAGTLERDGLRLELHESRPQ